MARTQGSSDPLPYTELDRAAKAKAAKLSGHISVTYQHAIGTLIEFWDLNGDPRALERIVQANPAGPHELVLDRAELCLRFKLASGKDCDPAVLVALGLVEQRAADSFRVRGMSRFFEPIAKRIEKRARASTGGKASVETRKERYGSAQPLPSKPGSASGSASASASGSASGPVEAEPNPSDQRTADSGQRSENNDDLFPEVVPLKPPRELSDHEVWHQDFMAHRERKLKGAELPPEVLEEKEQGITLAFINVVGAKVKRWFLDHIPGLGEYSDEMTDLQVSLIDAYLELSWPASKSPPYPFRMFASEKVWEPLALALAQRHAQESLQ